MVADARPETPIMPMIPDALPVLPLRGGTVVFPLALVPLVIGQTTSVKLIDGIMRDVRMLAMVSQRNEGVENPGPDDLHSVGTVGVIQQLHRNPDGTLRILVQGLERIRIIDYITEDPYLVARIETAPDRTVAGVETEALRRSIVDAFRRLSSLSPAASPDLVQFLESLDDPRQVVYFIATLIPFSQADRQALLELDPLEAKLRRLLELLQHEIAVAELGRRITDETTERMTKAQREYYLREQLRAIERELGEDADNAELSDLRRRAEAAQLPEHARTEVERELHRLEILPETSPEFGIIRTYLDWMVSLPWSTLATGEIDIERARFILNRDHYDLAKVKDRILEHLAVRKLRQDRILAARVDGDTRPEQQLSAAPEPDGANSGQFTDIIEPVETPSDQIAREPILCFVGPPGVGKTSLGQSIARSLDRPFVRVSLGGVRDEAEIRGHRRTYIGAMPGRIIQAIRQAGVRNPVFMLDEVDKVGSDWRGDPASALLEVLDPSQNQSFVDNYIGVPFDLTQVLFIATANTLDTIPVPLLDRMEVLPLAGYTDEEKIRIATDYLVPKEVAAHGLKPDELAFEEEAIRRIIRGYTREAGVRNLEREIAAVCRKFARDVAEGQVQSVVVTEFDVERYLGHPRYYDDVAERTDRPGVATGLAWTPAGGDVLFVEATMLPSRNEQLILTGMLGDVMQESARAAVSWVQSNAEMLGIEPTTFEGQSIHLHVPAGAVPKDGPSAGVTMVTALVSLATGLPVRSEVAMTGEITLRGKILPVGGIREKVLAGQRAGIQKIILPKRNEPDLEDVPAELRETLDFVLVDTIEKALEAAIDTLETSSSDVVGS